MSHSKYLEATEWVKAEKRGMSPTGKLILAFIIGFLALTPAILGIYWEWFLPK